MIYATTAQVTPETELARLTLISSSTEETIRRQSLLGGQRPALGDINGQPLHGPLPKPIPEVSASDSLPFGNDAQQKMVGTSHNGTGDDASSDGTLVEAPAAGTPGDNDFTMVDSIDKQQQDQIIENKENLAPTKEDIDRAITLESTLMPLAESPSSLTNEQRPRSPVKTMADSQGDSKLINGELKVAPPPNRAPPVPPRQKLEDEKKAMQEEVEIGAQQDVTEVIANVLFQLQCAIKAESVDDSGEQIDQIKKLFFGKQKSYTTNEQGVIRSKEEFISDIKIDVASGPRDIYAALDGAFDVQEVEVGGRLEPQYATVSHMPPVMQILVQRAQFDQEKKTSFKSNHHLELKETIYMDRYLDSPDPDLAQRRQDSWHWKKELSRLEKRRLQLRKTEACVLPRISITVNIC
jgi:ubiquitin carboxyl-terminal hydrolase 25/28